MTLDVPLSLIKEPRSWTGEDVVVWLHWLGLAEHVPIFRDTNVDGAKLLQLSNNNSWDVLGVSSQSQQQLLSNAIEPLRRFRQVDSFLGGSDVVAIRVIEGPLSDETFLVGPGGCSGGRHSGSNAVVIKDNYVSRKHFRVDKMPSTGGFGIQDVGSTTGTFVIMRDNVMLKPNMVFQMGGTEITVSSVDNLSCVLEATEGNSKGMRAIVSSDNTQGFTLGRDAQCNFCLDDQQISNFHAEIKYVPANVEGGPTFVLSDSWSTNRTWVRLSPDGEVSDMHPIRAGDVFKVGNSLFLVLDGASVLAEREGETANTLFNQILSNENASKSGFLPAGEQSEGGASAIVPRQNQPNHNINSISNGESSPPRPPRVESWTSNDTPIQEPSAQASNVLAGGDAVQLSPATQNATPMQ